MKLNIFALAVCGAVIWGVSVLCVGMVHLSMPGYGSEFLAVVASLYPGFEANGDFSNVILGTAYAVADGAIGGALVAWLYNLMAALGDRRTTERRNEPVHDLRHPAR